MTRRLTLLIATGLLLGGCPNEETRGRDRWRATEPPTARATDLRALNGELPSTRDPVVVRTDFSDDAAWAELKKKIIAPGSDGFEAYVRFVDDPAFENDSDFTIFPKADAQRIHGLLFIADRHSFEDPEHPILVVALSEASGQTFRIPPSLLWAPASNIPIANMEFEAFLSAVDPDGVFRGFPNP